MEATMNTNAVAAAAGSLNKRLAGGYILSTIAVLFLLMDGVMKLFKPSFVINGTVELGYNQNVIVPLGIILTACTVLYAVPRTAVLGAVLLTGYLGGAVATHVRVGADAFPVLFPLVFGMIIWGGLYLRDSRVAALLPVRR